MPIFPILEFESLVQEKDKTRLSAVKSYVAGTTPITKVELSPGKGAALFDVTDTQFLEWQWELKIDIDSTNNTVDFREGSGSEISVIIPDGSYFIRDLASDLAGLMSLAGSQTYTASVSADNVIALSALSAFNLLPVSGSHQAVSALPELGFGVDVLGLTTYSGSAIERVKKLITLTVTNLAGSETITETIEVISERADRLFSTDSKLQKHESDILRFIPDGRASYKDVHRRAQTLILAWLDTQGFIDDIGYKFTLKRIRDIDEVTEWATMMTLRLIFEGLVNAQDDIFTLKAKKYRELEDFYRGRATLRIDMNQDGKVDVSERLDIRSAFVVRR